MAEIDFNRDFTPEIGAAVPLGASVRRVTAPNGGPFTFRGTNSYIVGHGRVAVIDLGPDDAAHIAALLAATAGEEVAAILVTHTHRDHSGGVQRLVAATGAPVLAGGAHRFARPPRPGEDAALEAGADLGFRPDRILADGERIAGDGFALEAIATPRPCRQPHGLALRRQRHAVLGRPCHGLVDDRRRAAGRPDGRLHGLARHPRRAAGDGLSARPRRADRRRAGLVRALRAHRRLREAAILSRIARGDRTIPEVVAVIYRETPAALHGAAALSVLAHVEDLVDRGRLRTVSGSGLDACYEAVSAG